jgi:hypothetical protein
LVATRLSAACIALLLASSTRPSPGGADSAPILVHDDASPAEARAPAVTATCTLEPGPIQTSFSYAWTTPDAFTDLAWLAPRASCTACGPSFGLEIKTVSFGVRWFGACSATAQVTIVGSTGTVGCRVPNPGNVLYGPASFPIVGTGSLGVVHTLTLPSGWCVGPDAFVMVHFVGLGACYPGGSSPGLTRTGTTCVGCKEYISTTVTNPLLTDWCTIATNSLWMQVEADCCGPVGVGPGPDAARTTAISILGAPGRRIRMRITVAERGPVELNVYDLAGRRVRNLLRTELDAGDRFVDWDATSDDGERLPTGVYQVRLSAGTVRTAATAVVLE